MISPDERTITHRISPLTPHYNIETTEQGVQVELFNNNNRPETPQNEQKEDVLTSVVEILTEKGYAFSLEQNNSTYIINIRKQLDPRIGHECVDEYHPTKITDEILSNTPGNLPPVNPNKEKITLFSNASNTDEVYLVEGDFIRKQDNNRSEEVYFYVVGIDNNRIIKHTIGKGDWTTTTRETLEKRLTASDHNTNYTLIPNTLKENAND